MSSLSKNSVFAKEKAHYSVLHHNSASIFFCNYQPATMLYNSICKTGWRTEKALVLYEPKKSSSKQKSLGD
eukprot:UN15836